VKEAETSILAKLFSSVAPEQKRWLGRAALTVNVVATAFIIPHEVSEASDTYYKWVSEAAIDTKQVEACAAPLALPAPDVEEQRRE
jgi:uncharacterized membrane protein